MKAADIIKRYNECDTEKQKYVPLWREISKYTGIKVDPDDTKNEGDDLDSYTLDPTTSLSTVQSADYLKGIIIGTGEKGFEIMPSDDVLELVDISAVKQWYEYITGVVLREINHPCSGFHTAFQSYFYDQVAFGNSGIGTFKNELKNNPSANALIFREYGVDTMAIDEGKNGVIDIIFNKYKWRTNQFVAEFCFRNGEFDSKMFEKLPEEVKSAYNSGQLNKEFKVVQGIMPNEEYNPEKLGIAGAKYHGAWFLDGAKDKVFFEEDFKERPISFGRPVKVRGEIYGRAYGTMLLSSIRCVNEIVNGLMITLDKMRDPAVGVWGDAVNGDGVIDTSAGSLTTFDPTKLNGNTPIFPLQDIGDPSKLIQFLLPYLNEKLATAFKVDLLLDFSSASNMTATESLQRYSIRNKSILGLIIQQINDVYIPTIQRAISILWDMGRLGVMPDEEYAAELQSKGLTERIIPESVLEAIKSGKTWYKITFNNEVEKISNTDKIDNLTQLLQIMQGLLAVNPQLAQAVDWYSLLNDVSGALGFDTAIMSEREFKKQIEAQAQQQAQLMNMQAQQLQSQTTKNNASAMRDLDGLENVQGQ